MILSRSESASLWSPLALTVIGGTTVATFLTLFIIPSLYYHMEIQKQKVSAWLASFNAEKAEA
jgi:HAE1 family hydrophobic/amphiphilic exporter-1